MLNLKACEPGFAHLEHTADVLIEAKGRSLSEAFENAALGVYEVMTDTSKVEPKIEEKLEVESFDLQNLLYRWIEELLIKTDEKRLLFSKFKVWRIEVYADKMKLRASAWGEEFDSSRHLSKTLVKAMTYAQMSLIEENGCWEIRFVVDI
ncbi:MAG: archease [Acidilobaceae archaeon]